jgi:hypothetical protein
MSHDDYTMQQMGYCTTPKKYDGQEIKIINKYMKR